MPARYTRGVARLTALGVTSVLVGTQPGCHLIFERATPADDAPAPPGDASLCHGTGLVQLCLAAAPVDPLDVRDATTLDTDSSPLCTEYLTANGTLDPEACVIAATSIAIGSALRAKGGRPLVLIASGAIVVEGTGAIDVASTLAELGGGALGIAPDDCMIEPAGVGGGGAGGSLGGAGGAGGGSGGMPVVLATPDRLHGGCRGGNGLPVVQLSFGAGGGAVALLASTIQIDGTIDASGQPGRGGRIDTGGVAGGGGGGGSGGMIVLDAAEIQLGTDGAVFANGGGGGGGSSNPAAGGDGTSSTAPSSAGVGGGGGTFGGVGGDGSAGTTLTGADGQDATSTGAAAGGGGGGAGVIRVFPRRDLVGALAPPPF